jgi:hypothetical protein
VIRDALKSELERSGHRVWEPGQGRDGIVVKVGLTQFLIDSKMDGARVELVGSIQADVMVFAARGNRPQILVFGVEGAYQSYVPMAMWRSGAISVTPKRDIKRGLNGALAEFVRRFCLEPQVRQVFTQVPE